MNKLLLFFFLLLCSGSAKLNAQTPPDCAPIITIGTVSNTVCSGTTVTFNATVLHGGTGEIYKWKKNNIDAGIINSAVYSASNFHNGDVVICEYSCKTACGVDTTLISTAVTMQIPDDINPIVGVANSDTLICEGQVTVFTAEAQYGSGVPAYQWVINDIPVGIDSPAYSTTTLVNGSKIECFLTVTFPACPAVTKKASGLLSIYVYPRLHPAINIIPSRMQICRGEEVVFTATANGGTSPSFAWFINGISTGANAPDLTTSSLKDGDVVSCTITIDPEAKCPVAYSAPSNTITMQVKDFTDPTVSISAPDLDVCTGMPIHFTASTQNAGNYQIFHWKVNGNATTEYSSGFSSSQFANGDKISCILTTNVEGCPFNFDVGSNIETVIIRSAPVVSFSPPDTSIMYGEQADLNASVSGNFSSIQWTPAAMLLTPQSPGTRTVPLFNDTTFNLLLTDINGCTASGDFLVKVLHPLYMPNAFTPNGDGLNDIFRIPPGSSINLNEFLVFDRWGKQVFKTKSVSAGWDGRYKGKFAENGVYVYLVKGTVKEKVVVIKGSFVLLR